MSLSINFGKLSANDETIMSPNSSNSFTKMYFIVFVCTVMSYSKMSSEQNSTSSMHLFIGLDESKKFYNVLCSCKRTCSRNLSNLIGGNVSIS